MSVILQRGGGVFAGNSIARGAVASHYAPALPVAVTLDEIIRAVLPRHRVKTETHDPDARMIGFTTGDGFFQLA